ncbi:MAG: prepilin peptidase [Rhodobacteraceae bacterium]|nr:prepilin peptidase [Paracoccaceae bacterium]
MTTYLLEVLTLTILIAALLQLALIDIRTFEVSPTAAILACTALTFLLYNEGTSVPVHALFGAASALTVLALTYFYPARLGRGDAILFGIIGLAAGPEGTPFAAAVCLASLAVTVLAFLSLRGKPLRAWRRHIYPAGPAAAVAALLTASPSQILLAPAISLVALAAVIRLLLARRAAKASSPSLSVQR